MRFSVLALDLATTTGWAAHSTGMGRPFFGSLDLSGPAGEVGEPALALWNFLLDQHSMHNFTHVVYEAQHVAVTAPKKGEPRRQINIDTVNKLVALAGTVEMFTAACRRANGPGSRLPATFKAHIGTWRKHFIGHGSLSKAIAKQRCIAACEEFGWDTFDHNAAEACGILDYFMTLLPGPDCRPWRDANFMVSGR